MKVLLTGATGFVGRVIVRQLLAAGDEVVVLTRHVPGAALVLGSSCKFYQWRNLSEAPPAEAFAGVHAVINLAGEGIADKPWTAQRKRELHDSRIALTEELVEWLRRAKKKPRVLISGSAIGWYGNQGDKVLEEGALPHVEYVHELCRDWEQAAAAAEAHGLRVCLLRTGVVIGAGGGMLRKLLPLFGLGIAGAIHVADALEHGRLEGLAGHHVEVDATQHLVGAETLAQTLHLQGGGGCAHGVPPPLRKNDCSSPGNSGISFA
mgnify:CR=1 FL=1